MTSKQPKVPVPVPGTGADRILQTVRRLGLNESRAAEYFGVPVFTVRKWCTGEREPTAAVSRLLDVLGIIETMAPAIHDSLVPPVTRRIRAPKH